MHPVGKGKIVIFFLAFEAALVLIAVTAIQKRQELGPSATMDFSSKDSHLVVSASWAAAGSLASAALLAWAGVLVWRGIRDQ